MAASRRLQDRIRGLIGGLGLRANSLIITVYGDSLMPHGGSVWLGSLIRLVEPLGLSERIVRTAVFRLAKDDWLASTQIGRRSYYAVTDSGRRRFEAAYRRIYAPLHRPWDGEWSLIFSSGGGLSSEQRETLRRELGWMGFGAVGPGAFAHPAADHEAVRQLLHDLDATERVAVMRADSLSGAAALRGLVQACWSFDKLAADYAGFLARFRPLLRELEGGDAQDPAACFVIRTLLMHDYRRVLLRDPMLPEQLLPVDWPGTASRVLCRNLYRILEEPSERHLMATAEGADGRLPEVAPSFHARFGGLGQAAPRLAVTA